MGDDYIRRQEKKIKKRLWKLFGIKHLLLIAVCLFSLLILCAMDPPPQKWSREEITVADMVWKDRPTVFSRYRNPGYKVTDQNGNVYWIDEDIHGMQVGGTYAVRYVERFAYRFFRSVEQGDSVILDFDDSVAQWNRDLQWWILGLIIFLLSFCGIVRYAARLLSDAEIRQCREKIRSRRAKTSK